MKEFLKKWMTLFGLVIISVTIFPALNSGYWEVAIFIIQLLVVLLIICMMQLLTTKIPMRIHLFKYLIDLVITLFIVLLFGWVWKWYDPSDMGLMLLMIITPYIAAIFLDVIKVRQDVKAINQQIKRRNEKIRKEKIDDH